MALFFLHPAIMPAADDFSVVHNHRANRNAPFRQPGFGFLDGGLKKWIHGSSMILDRVCACGRQHLMSKIDVHYRQARVVLRACWPTAGSSSCQVIAKPLQGLQEFSVVDIPK